MHIEMTFVLIEDEQDTDRGFQFMAKTFFHTSLWLLLILMLTSCGNKNNILPIIRISPCHVCYGMTRMAVNCSFSIQCCFAKQSDRLEIEMLEGNNTDQIKSLRFYETTPDYAKGKAKNGGYYASYSVEFSVTEPVIITKLRFLLNDEKRICELSSPITIDMKDNVSLADMYFSFSPALIYTISLGDEYNYIVHVQKELTIENIAFADYLEINHCDIIDLTSGFVQAYAKGEKLRLEAGHDYSIILSFDYTDTIRESMSKYRDLKSSLCIYYALNETPDTTHICVTDLSCSGILNENGWIAFMKEEIP